VENAKAGLHHADGAGREFSIFSVTPWLCEITYPCEDLCHEFFSQRHQDTEGEVENAKAGLHHAAWPVREFSILLRDSVAL
jgi:hypothetical protein